MAEDEAKVRGMVAAIMGCKRGWGAFHGHEDHFQTEKDRAERKKKTTITAASFDHQVADKMGKYFDDAFLPAMKKLCAVESVVRGGQAGSGHPGAVGGEDQRRAVPETGCGGD